LGPAFGVVPFGHGEDRVEARRREGEVLVEEGFDFVGDVFDGLPLAKRGRGSAGGWAMP
jgi:hypothetical protein